MNAVPPKGSFNLPEEDNQPDLFDNPGIATSSPENADAEEEQAAKKKASENAFPFPILSLDELIENIAVLKPNLTDEEKKRINAFADTIDFATNEKFVIPKMLDTPDVNGLPSPNNASVFLYLMTHADQEKSEKSAVLHLSNGHGRIDIGEKGIFFKAADKDPKTGKKGAFTAEDAREIAILAMHDADLLPPNALKLTGTKEQKLMIQQEIEKLNTLLPEEARLQISNPVNDRALKAAFKSPDPTAMKPQEKDATPSPVVNGGTLGSLMAKAMIGDVRHGKTLEPDAGPEASKAEQQLEDMQTTLDALEQEEHIEKFGRSSRHQLLTEGGELTYKLKLCAAQAEDAISGKVKPLFANVIFTAPENGKREIISIEKTDDYYVGYQSPDIKLAKDVATTKDKDPLGQAFPEATGVEPKKEPAADTPDAPAAGPNTTGPSIIIT